MLKLKRCFPGFHGQFGRLHGFRSLTLYSTSVASKDGITNPLMVEFLVKSVGFSEDEAVSVVTNCKVSHRFIFTENSELVVSFLKDSGFNETHIRKLIIAQPMVLRSRIEETLKPKFRYFQELGFSGSDLGQIMSRNSYVLLRRSLKGFIVPTLERLRSIIGSDEQLVRFMLCKNSYKLFGHIALKHLPGNVLLLQSYGLPWDKIQHILLRKLTILGRSPPRLKELLKRVEETLGIPRTSGMFIHGIDALNGIRADRLESWHEVFVSYGWSRAEIMTLLRKHPLVLNVSVKEVSVRLKYFMEDLGYGSEYLASRPALLSYSMEKRIVPRTAVIKALKEKRLLRCDVSFYYSISMSEFKFMEKYVMPFKDTMPELYLYYMKTTGASLCLFKHSKLLVNWGHGAKREQASRSHPFSLGLPLKLLS